MTNTPSECHLQNGSQPDIQGFPHMTPILKAQPPDYQQCYGVLCGTFLHLKTNHCMKAFGVQRTPA